MSIDQAKALIERIKKDNAFAHQVMEIEGVEARMGFITNAGFDFTVEEMKALKAELSDDDLKAAALCSASHTCLNYASCDGHYSGSPC
jgi:predicted ribosomally synthesized peptide with nif11-like leader